MPDLRPLRVLLPSLPFWRPGQSAAQGQARRLRRALGAAPDTRDAALQICVRDAFAAHPHHPERAGQQLLLVAAKLGPQGRDARALARATRAQSPATFAASLRAAQRHYARRAVWVRRIGQLIGAYAGVGTALCLAGVISGLVPLTLAGLCTSLAGMLAYPTYCKLQRADLRGATLRELEKELCRRQH